MDERVAGRDRIDREILAFKSWMLLISGGAIRLLAPLVPPITAIRSAFLGAFGEPSPSS